MGAHYRVLVRRTPFTTVPALARYLGVSTRTIRRYITSGILKASRVQVTHYADERPRKTMRGQWRIYAPDLDAFLAHHYVNAPALPESLWVGSA